MMNVEDYIGKTYNYLTILEPVEKKRGNWYVRCKCRCGNYHIARLGHLLDGSIWSCGCRNKEKGRTGTHNIWSKNKRIDKIWNGMIYRCYNPKKDAFKHYGGRGIKVCDEWLPENNGVVNFYNWAINNGYKENLTIDRVNVNGDYCPENCRWVKQEEQMKNTRKNHYITIKGITKCLSEWLSLYNVKKSTFYYRISIGYSEYDALTMEKMK